MKIEIEVERADGGPLENPRTLEALARAVKSAPTLEEAAKAIELIQGLATYLGGRHVAVHPTWQGKFVNGSKRLALVTEDA